MGRFEEMAKPLQRYFKKCAHGDEEKEVSALTWSWWIHRRNPSWEWLQLARVSWFHVRHNLELPGLGPGRGVVRPPAGEVLHEKHLARSREVNPERQAVLNE